MSKSSRTVADRQTKPLTRLMLESSELYASLESLATCNQSCS